MNFEDRRVREITSHHVYYRGELVSNGPPSPDKNKFFPLALPPGVFPIKVVAGRTFALILSSEGEVYSVGQGRTGELGLGEGITSVDRPCKVTILNSKKQPVKARDIVAGIATSAIITTNGQVFQWGLNPGDSVSWKPKLQALPGKCKFLSIGRQHFAAVMERFAVLKSVGGSQSLSSTALYTWGQNDAGQLGRESFNVFSIGEVTGLPDSEIIDVCCGSESTFVLLHGGAVFWFGRISNKTEEQKVPDMIAKRGIVSFGVTTLFAAFLDDSGKLLRYDGPPLGGGSNFSLVSRIKAPDLAGNPLLVPWLKATNAVRIFAGGPTAIACAEGASVLHTGTRSRGEEVEQEIEELTHSKRLIHIAPSSKFQIAILSCAQFGFTPLSELSAWFHTHRHLPPPGGGSPLPSLSSSSSSSASSAGLVTPPGVKGGPPVPPRNSVAAGRPTFSGSGPGSGPGPAGGPPKPKPRGQSLATVTSVELSDEMLQYTSSRPPVIPVIHNLCSALVDHLHIRGIFRESGSEEELAELQHILNSGLDQITDFSCFEPIAIATLLKRFFRELPEPLLPPPSPELVALISVDASTKEAKEGVRALISKIAPENQAVLHYMAHFLNRVSKLSDINMMTASNLGLMFGPSFFGKSLSLNIRLVEVTNIIAQMIISSHDAIIKNFNIPPIQWAQLSLAPPFPQPDLPEDLQAVIEYCLFDRNTNERKVLNLLQTQMSQYFYPSESNPTEILAQDLRTVQMLAQRSGAPNRFLVPLIRGWMKTEWYSNNALDNPSRSSGESAESASMRRKPTNAIDLSSSAIELNKNGRIQELSECLLAHHAATVVGTTISKRSKNNFQSAAVHYTFALFNDVQSKKARIFEISGQMASNNEARNEANLIIETCTHHQKDLENILPVLSSVPELQSKASQISSLIAEILRVPVPKS